MSRVSLTALLLPLATVLSAQQAPTEPPDPAPVTAFKLPPAQEALLPNGLRLVVVPAPRQPVLSLVLSIPAGTAYDPPGKEGTAEMLAGLLTRGAGGRDALAFATAIENVGGSLSAAADPDFLTIQADVTSRHAPLAFELVADMVTRPALDTAEILGLQRRSMASLEAGFDDPATLAARVFLIATYRQYPYARRPTPRTVQSIQRSDLVAFRQARYRPAGSTLLLAGNITLASARALATRFFGRWQGARPAPLPAAPATRPDPEILLINRGGSETASILIGGTTFRGADTSYYAASLLNQVLGEGRTSRLARTLGGQRNWGASAASTFLRTARLGLFQASAQVPAGVADSAVLALRAELERLRTELVPASELEFARGLVSGGFALRIQTVGQLAAALAQVRMLGLPAGYIAGYRPRIEAVTAATLRALARRAFDPARLVTVVAGDAGRLYPRLSALGRTRIFAADGRELTPADITPRTTPLAPDPRLLAARTDSLLITSNGQPVGLQLSQLARAGDSITYTERTAVGRELSQVTRLTLDTLGHMRRLDQSGKVRGQDTRITLTYGGGRVRGEARVIGPEGPRSFTVDSAAGPAVLDDNAIQALLPALPWALNTRWTFRVFASGENRFRDVSLTVADIQQVAVPAGRLEAYRAYLEGGAQPVSFFVTTAAPHRLVRVVLEGSPIEFVAVNP